MNLIEKIIQEYKQSNWNTSENNSSVRSNSETINKHYTLTCNVKFIKDYHVDIEVGFNDFDITKLNLLFRDIIKRTLKDMSETLPDALEILQHSYLWLYLSKFKDVKHIWDKVWVIEITPDELPSADKLFDFICNNTYFSNINIICDG